MEFNLSDFVKPWISELDLYKPGKMLPGYVKLASNENNYGPSPAVVEILKQESSKVNVYPYKFQEVKEKVAEYCNVTPDNILLGNGSDEIIDMILKTFKGPVSGLRPTFAEYRLCAEILGGEYNEVNLNPDFSFPVGEFIRNSAKAGILFLCSPNSPTGGVIMEEEIVEVLDLGKVTVVDEAYFEFCGKTAIPLIEEFPNLIVMRTFAKAFAIAGLRIGYAISNPKIIRLMSRVRMPFNVNSLALEAAIAALDSIEYMNETVERIRKDREVLFEKLGERFKAFRSEANFILIDVSPLTAREFFDRLMQEKIIVREFGKFPGFEGEYARITIGTSEENQKLIEVLGREF